MIEKENIDINANHKKLEEFTKRVFDRMKLDDVPTTPEYYKIYFKKNLLEENDYEFRKYVAKLQIKEDKEECEKILSYEEKVDNIAKLNRNMLKNIQSTYKKNGYLIKFIKENEKESESLATQNTIKIFFKKLNSTIEHIHKSLQEDMKTIKELYLKNLSLLKELDKDKIFDTKYQVYKKEYFLSKLKKELMKTEKYNFQSYILIMKLNKYTISKLKTPIEIEKAYHFFAKIIQTKFKKDDIIGYLGHGVFGVIFSNLNAQEVEKVAIKFHKILGSASVFIDDKYLELAPVFAITEIKGNSHIDRIHEAFEILEEAYTKNIPYLIHD